MAVINIAPWIFAILYDVFLYLGRLIYHEIPIWGGRARGQRRPRAPSLRERQRRRLSLADMVAGAGTTEKESGGGGGGTTDGKGVRKIESTDEDEDGDTGGE